MAVKGRFTNYCVCGVFSLHCFCMLYQQKIQMYRILNLLCSHLALSKSSILPDCLTSDLSFEKHLINVCPTLATFNRRWLNVYLQRSFNMFLMLYKLSKNDVPGTVTQRKN